MLESDKFVEYAGKVTPEEDGVKVVSKENGFLEDAVRVVPEEDEYVENDSEVMPNENDGKVVLKENGFVEDATKVVFEKK